LKPETPVKGETLEDEPARPESRMDSVMRELSSHLPYSVVSATFALALTGVLTGLMFLFSADGTPGAARELFHSFHPPHMLLSAAATTAMFWRHEKCLWKAMIIGTVGAVGICGISDIFIPYLGGLLLGVHMHFHLCLLEHPLLVAPFVIVGVLTGLMAAEQIPRVTFFSHSSHVLVSSMASMLYLVSFGLVGWTESLGLVFLVVITAVLLPCCISDIVFPVLMASRRKVTAETTTGLSEGAS
jgi:hypothetical protein